MVVVLVALLVLAGAGTAVVLMSDDDTGSTAAPGATGPVASPPGAADPPPAPQDAPAGPDAAEVGDCIKVNDASATAADIETIDCADPLAVYRVAVREGSTTGECPNRNYVSYAEEGALLLCMTLNAEEGECFHEDSQQDTPVPCDSPDASYRVGKIHDGTDDANRCGEADARNALTYPVPPLTICRLEVG